VNAQDKYKWTPLHYAAMNNRIETAKMLIEAGADVNAKDKYKWTPLHYAKSYMRKEIPELNPNGDSL
jgi:ankyrin repeat protein